MSIVVSNLGKCELLDKMISDSLSVDENLFLKLYKDGFTPTKDSVIGDFIEADFTNYAQKTLTRSGWTAASIVSDKAVATYATQTWTCGVTTNVLNGYYVVAQTSNKVLWFEDFTETITLVANDVMVIPPKFTFDTES